MTIVQKRKILIRMQEIDKEIAELRDIRKKLASSEFVSASISSGGGSKSYSRNDIGKINEAIQSLIKEYEDYQIMLESDSGSTLRLNTILHIYG